MSENPDAVYEIVNALQDLVKEVRLLRELLTQSIDEDSGRLKVTATVKTPY